MKASPRILVIDTAGGEKMQAQIQKQFPAEAGVEVALAQTHLELEMLLRTTTTKRDWGTLRPWRLKEVEKLQNFDCAVVDAGADLHDEFHPFENPISYAITLAENKIPVLVYSPLYTGPRLQKLQSMVESPFISAFNPITIPKATLLSLTEPKSARKIMTLLKLRRIPGEKADKATTHLKKLLTKMNDQTHALCICILAHEEGGARFAMA